jgi:hypothetical protein
MTTIEKSRTSTASNQLSDISSWQTGAGTWDADGSLHIHSNTSNVEWVLESPSFDMQAGELTGFTFEAVFFGPHTLLFGVVNHRGVWARVRTFEVKEGKGRLSLAFRARRAGKYRLLVEYVRDTANPSPVIGSPTIAVRKLPSQARGGATADFKVGDQYGDSSAPHWNVLQRTVHRLCRRFRWVNTTVAAIEMRLEREEVLSLPQYVALCPTGQCNALCEFCSVTLNRTGITKKQLPYSTRGYPVSDHTRLSQFFSKREHRRHSSCSHEAQEFRGGSFRHPCACD